MLLDPVADKVLFFAGLFLVRRPLSAGPGKVGPLPRDVSLHLDLLHGDLALLVPDRDCPGCGLDAEGVLIVITVVVETVVGHLDQENGGNAQYRN